MGAELYLTSASNLHTSIFFMDIVLIDSNAHPFIVTFSIPEAVKDTPEKCVLSNVIPGLSVTSLSGISEHAILKVLKANIYKFAASIDTTTNAKLTKVFSDILENWLSVQEWTDLVKWVFTELKTSRAEMIVRTEVIKASNMWTQLGWEQSGVVEWKERYTALDERTCPLCAPMHGKIIDLHKNFYDKGEIIYWNDWTSQANNYDDVKHPTLHPRCRCTMLPVVKPA